jgi:hypothetical protein
MSAPAPVYSATLPLSASYRFADGRLAATGVIRFGGPGTPPRSQVAVPLAAFAAR